MKTRKKLKSATRFVLTCLPFAMLTSQSTEVTPRKYDWANGSAFNIAHVQIELRHGAAISKDAKYFYVAVLIRNLSNKSVAVPYPGDRFVNGMVDFIDHNGQSMLSAVPCSASRVPQELKLGSHEQRRVVVDVFRQECSMVDRHRLKRGTYSIEFMGYKKTIALID